MVLEPSSGQDSTSHISPSAVEFSDRLPRARRGYDVAATNALLAELAATQAELEEEAAGLRRDVARLEQQAQASDELLGQTLVAATSFAMKTREAARREAELLLRKTAARVSQEQKAIERLARERVDAERELVRLRHLAEELRSSLAGFLKSTLDELRPDGDRELGSAAPAVSADKEQWLTGALQAALQPDKR